MTEPLIQSQDTPTKHFTTSETEKSGNEFLAFKKYIMELNNMKNRLEVFNNLMNASYSHEPTAIPKEEIDFLREDNKNKSIIIQNLLENKNLLFRNKNERNTKCNIDVNNSKSDLPSDEIFMTYNKTFKLSQNIRNNKETNNIKTKNSFQALATADNIEDTLNEISNTTIHHSPFTINTIAGQSEKKEEKKNDRDTRRFYSEKNTRRKIREKGQTKCYREIIPWG